jgi:hypothetical protein
VTNPEEKNASERVSKREREREREREGKHLEGERR